MSDAIPIQKSSEFPIYQTQCKTTLSSPNFSTYHFLPLTALGSIEKKSLNKNALAGAQGHLFPG